MNEKYRLFIAIEFPADVVSELERTETLLRRARVEGNFTAVRNFHLTLAFLGDTEPSRVPEIADLMDDCAGEPIPLTIGPLDFFHRREGDILIRRLSCPPELAQLQKRLSRGLRGMGFRLENRLYQPHLTLARECVLPAGTALEDLSGRLPDLPFTAGDMTLFRSHRPGGRLTYTPLHTTVLP